MLGTEEIDKLIEKYQDNDDLQGLIREYRVLRFMRPDSDTPRGYSVSVHNSSTARIDKAIEQYNKAKSCKNTKNDIAKHAKNFLRLLGFKDPKSVKIKSEDVDYDKLVQEYGLNDKRDIVWMKFSKEQYLCTVACSNDINVDAVPENGDINEKNEKGRGFKYNTSAVIMHVLGLKWDEEVIIIPLTCIPDGLSRGDIETGIGNYLIAQGIPILDYYSHNY